MTSIADSSFKDYSQRGEQRIILDYFAGRLGTFLDVGAYDPFKFSNTRALYEKGWSGVMIEPAQANFETLKKEYGGEKRIQLFNFALGDKDKMVNLWDSNGDALSSTDEKQVKKWSNVKFTKTKTKMLSWHTFLKKARWEEFDFINIDVEDDNLAINILRQINLTKYQLICVECNEQRNEMKSLMRNFTLVKEFAENLIYVV